MKVYLAGPMRGRPNFNFPAFHYAAKELRSQGLEVFSPAERDEERHGPNVGMGSPDGNLETAIKEHGFNLREALAADLKFICEEADAVYLLPGWENSKGAQAERAAAIALGLRIVELRTTNL